MFTYFKIKKKQATKAIKGRVSQLMSKRKKSNSCIKIVFSSYHIYSFYDVSQNNNKKMEIDHWRRKA